MNNVRILEVTNPNFVVNKEFTFVDSEGNEITFYEDDYLDIRPLNGKLVINSKYIIDNPSTDKLEFDDYIEQIEPSIKIIESSLKESQLLEAKIILK